MSNWITRVATDVGGTFTDLVRFDVDPKSGRSRVTTAKTATTPPDFERGVLDVLRKGGVALPEIGFLAHGTTVVINALTERTGAKVGLITTEGFRDTLEIARGNRPDLFNLHYRKPKPFVPRYLRRELPGRMNYRGTEVRPVDLSPLAAIVADFRADGVEAVAICFLHSYANDAHERAAEAEVRRLWPGIYAVSSHRIAREWREYERTSTAVLSAYVQPTAERYLRRLSDGLASRGFAGSPYVMQSNGGVDSLQAAARTPITMIESGPSSGVWGAAQLGALIGDANIIALDIGGTTAKCSLVDRGNIRIVNDYWIGRDGRTAGYPVMVPVVDMVEIGNGGGSVAWVDEFGKLHVGPRSAGAVPGPAAYGMGGTDATTTDANLWLGRINRDNFSRGRSGGGGGGRGGGEMQADMEAVEAALREVGGRLGMDPDQAAAGIVRIANNNMVNALKLVSLNRGFDPRDFTLIAFGGGGGMHAVALAAELGISKVVIPADAAVFSAWGMMMSDLRRDYIATRLLDLVPDNAAAIESALAETEEAARAQFRGEGVDSGGLSFTRFGTFRYQNQEHTTEVALGTGVVTANRIREIRRAFETGYEREYTYRLDAPVEMVGIHVIATATVGRVEMRKRELGPASATGAQKGSRKVDFAQEGIMEAAIYDAGRLRPGMRFAGPAIVEDAASTVVVHRGNEARVDGFGNVVIHIHQ
ncbi:MAG: hydantoinase/oxoprolinase family protein [Spirochaetaceae bacterium]|nr:hydantoinase/oxoprolinase family protein [Spirochaetaceae bacterium]